MEEHPTTLAAHVARLAPTVILAVLTAFATSWLAARDAQNELRFKVEMLEQANKSNASAISQNAAVIQSLTVKQAELGRDLSNIAEQLKDISGRR